MSGRERASRLRLLVTCEHAGNAVPRRYASLFRGRERLLRSHRGWDPGGIELARKIARRLGAPLIASTVTRLLVDPNRSSHNPRVFSEVTRDLDADEKRRILERHHRPHRDRVASRVSVLVGDGARVLHVGVHTFTPVLSGEVRRADVSLLYDPRRRGERELCALWRRSLAEGLPGLRVLRNTPYRGAADGLTTALRRRFAPSRYLGIELEVNQKHLAPRATRRREIETGIIETLEEIVLAGGRARRTL